MTWATVITLAGVAVASLARALVTPKPMPEGEKRTIAFVRSIWFAALAVAMWERYL